MSIKDLSFLSQTDKHFVVNKSLYEYAAEQGQAYAQYKMGELYYEGKIVEQNYDEAIKWFKKAAEQDNADAQCALGTCYMEGHGVKEDYEEGIRWFKKAITQGNVSAHVYLGYYYMFHQNAERQPQYFNNGFKMVLEAAEQGDLEAQVLMGDLYYDVIETQTTDKRSYAFDYKEAVKWYKKAAVQGDSDAQYALGKCYIHGHGVEPNYIEAVKWFQKAAELGQEDAQKALKNKIRIKLKYIYAKIRKM